MKKFLLFLAASTLILLSIHFYLDFKNKPIKMELIFESKRDSIDIKYNKLYNNSMDSIENIHPYPKEKPEINNTLEKNQEIFDKMHLHNKKCFEVGDKYVLQKDEELNKLEKEYRQYLIENCIQCIDDFDSRRMNEKLLKK